jgi:drug/metabolite transporter (DMT)-like permease
MLKKSRKSTAILASICADSIFLGLILVEQPNLARFEQIGFLVLAGLVLLAIATGTFYSIVSRMDERYYGPGGALGWALTGICTALTVGFGQRLWPDPFGLAVVAVFGFMVFRFLVFRAIWWFRALHQRSS